MVDYRRFNYRPLDSLDTIRVLVLDQATSPIDPLNCTIRHCERDAAAADYCAVSYAWGQPKYTRFLTIRSADGVSKLKITRTVDTLLRRMRAIEACRLWIDCICLNQQDDAEKAFQIPVMGCIYRSAKMVHVWLGEADEYTESALKGLEFQINNPADFLPSPRAESLEALYARTEALSQKVLNHGMDPFAMVWGKLRLPSKPWFSRRWVIQEACLARDALVHCGQFSIPFARLLEAAQTLVDAGLNAYSQIARLRPQSHEEGILELLFKFDWAECSDNRDRIAALAGLLPASSQIPLDYALHWTQLYRQTAEHVLVHGDQHSGLELLRHLFEFGSIKDTDQFSTPSWVPDWSKPRLPPVTYDLLDGATLGFWRPQRPRLPMEAPAATSVALWNRMLQISWNELDSNGQNCCSRVNQVCTFDTNDEKPLTQSQFSMELILLMMSNGGRPLFHISLAVLMLTVGELAHDLDEETGWNKLWRDMFFTLNMLQLPGSTQQVSICSLRRDQGLFPPCSSHIQGPLNALYCIGKQRLLPGDFLVPLWNDPPIHRGWSKIAGLCGEEHFDILRLATMKMLVVRETAALSARERLSHDEYLVAKGTVVGCAVGVYMKEDENISAPQKDTSSGTERNTHLRRCAMLLV